MIKHYSLWRIYEYASERSERAMTIFAFSHSKTAISFNILWYRKGTSIWQAPVFWPHQSIAEKPMEVYHLDEWIIIALHVAGFLYTSSNILILPLQFSQIRFKTLPIALFKVPNTGAFTVLMMHVLCLRNIWRVSSQNGLTPFWSIWDIWDLSCWNTKKIKFVILLIITSRIFLYIMRKVSL